MREMELRIRNVPGKVYRRLLKEARRHKNSIEDEVRDAIFMYLMGRYPTQRALLIAKLSRSACLRFLRRQRAYKHLIH